MNRKKKKKKEESSNEMNSGSNRVHNWNLAMKNPLPKEEERRKKKRKSTILNQHLSEAPLATSHDKS